MKELCKAEGERPLNAKASKRLEARAAAFREGVDLGAELRGRTLIPSANLVNPKP